MFAHALGKFLQQRISKRLAVDPVISMLQALGKHNIICIEDLVHEIFTVGPAFKQASNFLWPFKLSAARVNNFCNHAMLLVAYASFCDSCVLHQSCCITPECEMTTSVVYVICIACCCLYSCHDWLNGLVGVHTMCDMHRLLHV